MAISLLRAVLRQATTGADHDHSGIEFWTDPEHTRWLLKQGDHIKTWRRRWFVLKQGKLFWFKDSDVNSSSKMRGVIPVTECLIVRGAEDVVRNRCGFEVSSRGDVKYFVADSVKEKEEWISSIGREMVLCSKSVTDGEIVDYDYDCDVK